MKILKIKFKPIRRFSGFLVFALGNPGGGGQFIEVIFADNVDNSVKVFATCVHN